MAYFSNGSEGMDYQERFCMKCKNWRFREGQWMGCPIWEAHLMFAYEECNSQSNAKSILDMLIPMVPTGLGYDTAGECTGFMPKSDEELAEEAKRRQQMAELERREANKFYAQKTIMPAMAEWAKARGVAV